MAIDRDVWLKALSEAGFNDTEDDQDAVSVAEFATMIGLTHCTAQRRLDQLVGSGAATKTKKLARMGDGTRRRVAAYRLNQKPAKKRGRAA